MNLATKWLILTSPLTSEGSSNRLRSSGGAEARKYRREAKATKTKDNK